MLFCTQDFLLFFVIVLAVYWAIPWQRARVYFLLGASCYFYASWNTWLAGIIAASSTADYLFARGMGAASSRRRRRCLLGASLSMNLGLLFYFKYANFFLQSVEAALHAAGRTESLPLLRVILPIGISFYTFEAISYTVDVYRRRIPAERNLAHFMLFILFFPHLVAGPIVRARDFLPQVRRRKRASWPRAHLGCRYILMGMFKKLVIADHMARFTEPVFANPGQYRTSALWIAAFAYALQIYCDFSGYSDLALGTARLLGYRLAQNFNMPYLAANVTELWHRWHISLSTWLRDYIFFPLVRRGRQNRCPECQRRRNYRAILITMTVCGLWHGANWTFVVWGAIHGFLQIGHRVFRGFAENRPALNRSLRTGPGTALRIALTFVTWCLATVVFRSTSLGAAATMLSRMMLPSNGLAHTLPVAHVAWAGALLLGCHLLAVRNTWQKLLEAIPSPVRGLGYAGVLVATIVLAPVTAQTFIYFQF
jgi:alginate O-acetyltransferase complex protein AlgI